MSAPGGPPASPGGPRAPIGGSRLALGALLLAAAPLLAEPVPTPESVFGFAVGADRRLPDWTQIVSYFRRLGETSPRVLVEELGRTTEDRPYLLVTITSEANRARLEEIRATNLRLADPRGLDDEEAQRLVERGKVVVAIGYGIHSTEVAGTLSAVKLADLLARSPDPGIQEILDQAVILLIPSQNPDGTQRVAEWYRRTLGTPFEGGPLPFLYQRYTGHDDNRDWYMFTQVETRLAVQGIHDRWRPQVVGDVHQMSPRAARIFVPPYLEPYEPNVDPLLRSAIDALGSSVASRLKVEGRTGVVSHAIYDAWSPSRAYPHTHGGVRILIECASALLASPATVRFEDLEAGLGYDPKRPSWNFPDPWPGGTWRIGDAVDYQLAAATALLSHASQNRQFWLRTFLDVNRHASARSEPYAFVVPARQKDPLAAAKLLGVLQLGGVEVRAATLPFDAAGRAFPRGSHVVLMAQPYSGFAKMLLERQSYPDLRLYPGGPPQRPYDVTAHTLPLLMGVDAVSVPAPFPASLSLEAAIGVPPGRLVGRGPWFALGHKNGDLVAVGRLLRGGVPVRWATSPFKDGGRAFPAGTLLVSASGRKALEALARELGLTPEGVGGPPGGLRLRSPRLGLYQSFVPSMDEGWTRFVLEKDLGVPYTLLHDAEIRSGALGALDVLILPDQAAGQILRGHAPGRVPPEYEGGLGSVGVRSLEAFVRAGGTLIALNTASELPVREFSLPVTNALDGVGASAFYCPGALLQVEVDPRNPLGHGLEPLTPVWFEGSPAFAVDSGNVVARYADDKPLLSGWLLGGQRLAGHAALVEVPLGKGRVVLFGFRPQYRAQSWATYIALLNAIYTSAATPGP